MSDPPESSESLPRRFGRFVLFDKIGEGGMARIYLGRQSTELGGERLVVVKQILPILASSQEFSRLLIEEAKLAAGLSHGNVVQVIDLGREDDVLYIAMEYVEGFDLSDLLKRCSRTKTPLPVEFSLLIVIETLRALEYAHRKKDEHGRPLGIVHRDVSPSNVLVSFDGEVKLCDFGIARAMGVGAELPTEAIQGKAGYMSPEAAAGAAPTRARTCSRPASSCGSCWPAVGSTEAKRAGRHRSSRPDKPRSLRSRRVGSQTKRACTRS
ncbi:MAG: serine/threonine protein kinase [Myxococcales bacterium]|nr:serine/threonine protein kinase [Myxococcales bacterium]